MNCIYKKYFSTASTINFLSKKLVFEAKSKKTESLLIWMHGLGDSAESFVGLFDNIVPSHTKIVLLNAPQKPVSLNGGYVMNSWYDIYSNFEINHNDIVENSKIIVDFIKTEIKDLNNDFNRVLIGGFSQGGCMSLYIGTSLAETLGGVICCSGYLVPKSNVINNNVKMLVCHGELDQVITHQKALRSFEKLKNNQNVIYHFDKNLEHSMNVEELHLIKDFVGNRLNKI